jgi:aspartyl-tRNA(Asn)/glutamyl-tRNA(Gln) amidotransferase subunit C
MEDRMAITREDVLHVAALAQLELSEEEIARLTEQLGDILEAVGKVSELDLSDVPPTSHPLAVVNVFRADEPQPSLPLEDVFANVPERDGDHFRVPPTGVAEESSA